MKNLFFIVIVGHLTMACSGQYEDSEINQGQAPAKQIVLSGTLKGSGDILRQVGDNLESYRSSLDGDSIRFEKCWFHLRNQSEFVDLGPGRYPLVNKKFANMEGRSRYRYQLENYPKAFFEVSIPWPEAWFETSQSNLAQSKLNECINNYLSKAAF